MAEPTMLEQLLQAMEDAKTVIREAHEATRDLRQATKEARELGRELQRDEFEPWLNEQIKDYVSEFAEAIGEETRRNREKVITQFKALSNLLMYGNEQGRGQSLEPKIRKVAEERHAERNGGR